jgi:hypothetical protein
MASSRNTKSTSAPKTAPAILKRASAPAKAVETAPSKAAEPAPAKAAETAPTKSAEAAPAKTADATPAKAESGESAAAAPKNYSRGEGQKPVTQAYKDNWNAIFGNDAKKKKKR